MIRALAETDAGWHALVIGENTPNASQDALTEFQNLAESLGVADRVHWHPPTEALLRAYDACDAYAMCSVSETIGMVTIEALARKVPVVGTNAGGTPELLGHGKHGTCSNRAITTRSLEPCNPSMHCPVADDAHVQQFTKERTVKRWSETLAAIRASAS